MSKVLPHNLEAEQRILGLMIISKTCTGQGASKLTEAHFYRKQHAIIFKHISDMFAANKHVTLSSLMNELQKTNSLTAVGGQKCLIELANESISDTEFQVYLEILKDKFIKRNLITSCSAVMDRGFADNQDSQEFLDFALDKIWQATPSFHSNINIISPKDMYATRMQDLRERLEVPTISSGFANLDQMIGGFKRKDTSIIAGRPGMGKSAIKKCIEKNIAEQGLGVVSFALEQGFSTEADRMESLLTRIPVTEIQNTHRWRKNDPRIKKIQAANRTIETWNYHVVPSRAVSTRDVRSILFQLTQMGPLDIAFFDLFDRLTDVNIAFNKAQVITEKLGFLSQLSEEFNIHCCLIVQISRETEKKKNHRPSLVELKGSGGYEEVARLVMLLYREKYYHEESLSDEVELIIAKQNNGPTGTILFDFNPELLELTPTTKGYDHLEEDDE